LLQVSASGIVKPEIYVALLIVVVPGTEWSNRIMHIAMVLIVSHGESFEDILDAVPVQVEPRDVRVKLAGGSVRIHWHAQRNGSSRLVVKDLDSRRAILVDVIKASLSGSNS
jgi:hypothetical protein